MQNAGFDGASPDINESEGTFTVLQDEDGAYSRIRFGLLAIKNVGEHIVERVIENRTAGGPFLSLEEFLERIQDKDLNKNRWKVLYAPGALTDLVIEIRCCIILIGSLISIKKLAVKRHRGKQRSSECCTRGSQRFHWRRHPPQTPDTPCLGKRAPGTLFD